MSGRVSEQTRHEVAAVVAKGIDTMPAIAKALKASKTTVNHALRMLSEAGHVERHKFGNHGVLYSYTLNSMPDSPKPRRGSNKRLIAETAVPIPELWHRYQWPPVPQGRLWRKHRIAEE